MSVRKIIIGVGIVAVVGYFLLGNKIKKIIEQFQFVKVYPVAFKKFDVKWNDGVPFVTFLLDLKMVNPTQVNFDANIVAVTLKRILFYDKRNMLFGSSEVNINSINIPANSNIILKEIPVKLDLQTAITTAITILRNDGFKINEIRTEAVVSILGIDYTLS
ncbi:hypothetical protein [Flavobacterium succinicans]|jgi:hypothetical protein|uniref:Late embryogenesis abundant protein n=1 Tax=Flavobacterium succinicans TaxID=29536 RepID=A0A199XTR2_9FLAO|nr:hypothetical protein [Flavobacterium succinicans]OAZ04709.1 hypothetical protein FLB_05560 [Flavobacterium succinicans]